MKLFTVFMLVTSLYASDIKIALNQDEDLPSFLNGAPRAAVDEYMKIMKDSPMMSKVMLARKLTEWGAKQSSEIQKGLKDHMETTKRNFLIRCEVLRMRLEDASGSEVAKKELLDLIDLQENEEMTMDEIDRAAVKRIDQDPPEVHTEAENIWDSIRPDRIDYDYYYELQYNEATDSN